MDITTVRAIRESPKQQTKTQTKMKTKMETNDFVTINGFSVRLVKDQTDKQ
jgi:hypothetical protein